MLTFTYHPYKTWLPHSFDSYCAGCRFGITSRGLCLWAVKAVSKSGDENAARQTGAVSSAAGPLFPTRLRACWFYALTGLWSARGIATVGGCSIALIIKPVTTKKPSINLDLTITEPMPPPILI